MYHFLTLAVFASLAAAQSSCGLTPYRSVKPSIASGYRWQVVATGLSAPRGLAFDSDGNLLVVESGSGVVSAHKLSQAGNGCVSVQSSTNATEAIDLNHGIAVSGNGKTLYASSSNETFAWDYNAASQTTSNRKTVVGNMTGTDHSTRTLLLPKFAPGLLVVGLGSHSNLDFNATQLDTGSSSVKAFNLTNRTDVYSYQRDGLLLGWGLRNEVGLGEHPNSGGIWGVENSADQITRDGVDVHATNPGEEMNFLGYLNGTKSANQGTNFGYPWCFSAWDPSVLPQNQSIQVGNQFAIDQAPTLDNQNKTDAFCAEQTKARLVFHSHMAPLDIKFNNSGREAWVTFHGSWNSPNPVGYKLSLINFTEAGEPVEPLTSTTAATDIFSNQNVSACPGSCFRPATIAIDGQGRIFMSSDATGEIYLIERDASSSGNSSESGSSPTGTSGGASPSSTASEAHAVTLSAWWVVAALATSLMMLR
ncbi:soluble quino protein glucose dehydrogenase [Myriangium duriaei CBS 260.36]|uniref:Soluble quino protein glucose dehydrogenase n=1 Tax=Myriangium duriaei CBS 260.36 TaxID=1168546 RepID=A0A9P4JBJ3_9PEZI|nr:soluble quino protein glucose dehydrogenase [Myriangium duriaei CBS 260.36]